jgi:hypothetical protein
MSGARLGKITRRSTTSGSSPILAAVPQLVGSSSSLKVDESISLLRRRAHAVVDIAATRGAVARALDDTSGQRGLQLPHPWRAPLWLSRLESYREGEARLGQRAGADVPAGTAGATSETGSAGGGAESAAAA